MLTGRITDTVPVRRLREEMDRLLERYLGVGEPSQAWNPFRSDRAPEVNVWQDDDRVHVEAELPGLTEDDIELTILGNDLTIRGERIDPEPSAGATVHRRERFAGAFSRVVRLPVEINEDDVEATCWNGVLTVSLAKADAARLRHVPHQEDRPMTGDHIEITTGAARSGQTPPKRPTSGWSYRPRIDVTEYGDEFIIRADMPGATTDGIRINCENGVLTMHGAARVRQRRDTEYVVHEYGVGDFDREITCPDVVDTERIIAEYDAGVLTIHLPKSARAKRRRIPVRAA